MPPRCAARARHGVRLVRPRDLALLLPARGATLPSRRG
jgi:hypothetical protein